MNSKKCVNCEGINDLNSKFCQHCGLKLEEKKELNKCLKCETINTHNSKFCSKCGNKLKTSTHQNNNVSSQSNKSFDNYQFVSCPYCGSKIPVNSLKCGNCGEWIDKSKAPSEYNALIVLGYIFTFLGGFIGIIIAIYLSSRDNENAKKHSKYMLTISLIFIIIFALIILQYIIVSSISYSIS